MKLDKDIYTTKEVGRLLELDAGAIRAAIRTGTLKAVKFNDTYIIQRDNLADYLDYRRRRDNGE